MDSVYRAGGGVGGGREAEGGLNHPLAQRKSHCIFSKAQKHPQCTCQAKTVIGSSLTPHAALLMCPSGTVYSAVDHHEFTGSEKCCLVKADLVICSPVNGVSG